MKKVKRKKDHDDDDDGETKVCDLSMKPLLSSLSHPDKQTFLLYVGKESREESKTGRKNL